MKLKVLFLFIIIICIRTNAQSNFQVKNSIDSAIYYFNTYQDTIAIRFMQNSEDLSGLRWTIDEPADFEVASNVFAHFAPDIYFGWAKILELQSIRPQLFTGNHQIQRNEGASMGAGQKLWKRAT